MEGQKPKKSYTLAGIFAAFVVGIMLGGAFGAFSLANSSRDAGLFAVSDRSGSEDLTVEGSASRCVSQIVECSAPQSANQIFESL